MVVTRLHRETPDSICATGQKTQKGGETSLERRKRQYHRKFVGRCRTWQQGAKPGHDSRDGQRSCAASQRSLAFGKGKKTHETSGSELILFSPSAIRSNLKWFTALSRFSSNPDAAAIIFCCLDCSGLVSCLPVACPRLDVNGFQHLCFQDGMSG